MSRSEIPGRFSPLNRATWLQKIEKDLRGKSMDDLNIHFSDTLSISPIQHLEDLPENEEVHLTFSRQRHKIPGASLSVEDLNEIDNSLILKMLNLGAGSLYLEGDFNDPESQSELLDAVDTSLVEVYFSNGTVATPDGIKEAEIARIKTSDYDVFKASVLEQLSLERLEEKPEMTFIAQLQDNFYLNLCGLRALHVVMGQISRDLGNIPYKVWASSVLNSNEDLATGLLKSMSHYLAGFLGGAHHLSTSGLKDPEALRLHLNNAHLICLESKLPDSTDLIAGSFFLDKLTWNMAEDIWASLLRRLEQ